MNGYKPQNNVTIDSVMKQTFDSYKRADETDAQKGFSEWIKKSKKGVELIEGGYAKLSSLDGKHYVISGGNIDFPKNTVLELNQKSIDEYIAKYHKNSNDLTPQLCVSSFGPAMNVMFVGKQVEEKEAKSVLENLAMGESKFVHGKPCPGCGIREGGNEFCPTCG